MAEEKQVTLRLFLNGHSVGQNVTVTLPRKAFGSDACPPEIVLYVEPVNAPDLFIVLHASHCCPVKRTKR